MLARLLRLRTGEARTVGILFGWYFCAIGAAFIARAVRDSLFLAHLSADKLPAMYVITPLVLTVVGFSYARLEGRFRRDRLVLATAIGGAVALVVARALLGSGAWIFYALYVVASVIQGLVIMQLWTVASDHFTTRDAKRVFGIIGAGGTVADIAIGAAIALLAPVIGAENLLFVAAGLLVGIAVFSRALRRNAGPIEPRARVRPGKLERLPGTSHLRLVGASLICAVAVVTLVEFQFKAVTAAAFGSDRAGMVRYFGVMSIATGVISVVIQVAATRAVLHRLGVAGALLVLPLALAAGEVTLVIWPTLIAATILKAGDETFRFTVNDAASQLVFVPVPSRVRGKWKAIVESAWKPSAQLVLGLVLVGYRAIAPGKIAPLVGVALVVIALWLMIIARLRRAYVRALAETLRTRPAALDRRDTSAEELVAVRAALGGTADEMLAALELSAPLAAELADAIAPLCAHADPRIRRAACAVLGGVGVAVLRDRLHDDDREVRDTALGALAGRDPDASRSLAELAAGPTDDRVRAAELIGRAARSDAGPDVLAALIDDPDPAVARAAIIAAASSGTPALLTPLIARASGRAVPELSRALAACGAGGESAIAAALADTTRDPIARRELVQSLGRLATPAAIAALLAALAGEHDIAVRGSLARALARARRRSPDAPIDRAAVRELIDGELVSAYRAMAADAGLERARDVREQSPAARDAAALLSTTLRERQARHRERVFALLDALYPSHGFAVVATNLRESDPVRRANALEVLDGVLERELRARVLPLADDAPLAVTLRAAAAVFELPVQDEAAWLDELLADRAPWTIACAAYYAGMHRIAAVRGRLAELAGHADLVVREAAELALVKL
ncbi:MAG TPA: HEAT repeat domain-containing protein [Kofleriaceae bacterium]|jgi:AAA family ATP:ADP antiporter